MSRYLILLLVPVACAAPDVTPPPPEPSVEVAAAEQPAPLPALELPEQEKSPGRRRRLEREVLEATRDNDYRYLRVLAGQLEELEVQDIVDEAQALLRAGDPEGALVVLERALEVAPDGPSARLVHGEAAFQVASATADTALMEAALASFVLASDAPPKGGLDRWYRRAFIIHALRGAAHAARALGRKEESLAFARLELEWAIEQKGRRELYDELGEWPERTFVESCYELFVEVREADPERASVMVTEMEVWLSYLMVGRPRDPWAWSMLATVLLTEGRYQDAVDAAVGGLGRAPHDRTLPEKLADGARGAGGSDEVYAVFERLQGRQPEVALAWWYPAFERFDTAVGALVEEPIDELRRAEADFRRCRELEPEYTTRCLRYEALCRSAVGWVHYNRDELDRAADDFRSMEQLLPRGMTRQIEGRLPSGVQGLGLVADGHADRDELIAAAGIFLELHRYEPTEVDWAEKAGFFQRDAGQRLESYAAEAGSMAHGDLKSLKRRVRIVEAAGLSLPASDDEAEWRAVLGRAGDPLRTRSLEMFESSYAAYLAAAELAPDDVRILNDTASIAVRHLGRDLERAEGYLLRCVELGGEQLTDANAEGLDEEARLALTEAFGDAHENLGVLQLRHRNDPATARTWFERSIEIGPIPRPVINELYLPQCDEMSRRE